MWKCICHARPVLNSMFHLAFILALVSGVASNLHCVPKGHLQWITRQHQANLHRVWSHLPASLRWPLILCLPSLVCWRLVAWLHLGVSWHAFRYLCSYWNLSQLPIIPTACTVCLFKFTFWYIVDILQLMLHKFTFKMLTAPDENWFILIARCYRWLSTYLLPEFFLYIRSLFKI